MKTVSNDYKNAIKNAGREIAVRIVYTQNNEQIVLGNSEINSANLHYDGNILKSVMKQLDLDSNIDIPVKTVLTYEFGVKVNNQYEYINFGNFIVKDSKKQENTNSYILTCYDYMLNSMIDYESLSVTYPISVRNYLSAICTKLGVTFGSSSDNFINYNQNITEESFLDENGNSIGYTFRDVLDELAKITASSICINNSGQLEVRYITQSNVTIDESNLKNINVEFGEQYTVDVEFDDQILNYMNRQTVVTNALNHLNGIQYYLNDFDSTGITYLELCDRYNVQVGNETYSCVMLADEINVKRGLSENIHTEKPKDTTNEFTYVNDVDKAVRSATITLDQKIGEVDIRGKTINLTADNIAISSTHFSVTKDGNLSCSNASITGGNISLTSIETLPKFIITDSVNASCKYELSSRSLRWYGLNGGTFIIDNILTTPIINLTAQTSEATVISAYGISTPSINAGNIDKGSGTCSTQTTSISFNKTFLNVPFVVATPNTTANGVIALKIKNVTTTGFEILIGGTTISGNVDFDWIAISA